MPKTLEKRRLLQQTAVVLIALNGVLLVLLFHLSQKNMMENADQTVTKLLEFQTSIRSYVEKTVRPEVYRLQKDHILTDEYCSPALMSRSFVSRAILEDYLAQQSENLSGSVFRYASRSPLNLHNLATEHEAELLDSFESGSLSTHRDEIEENGKKYLCYAIPLGRFSSGCMKCHSDPKIAPSALVEHYGSTHGFHHKVGELSGLMSVTIPLSDFQHHAHKTFLVIAISTLIAFYSIYLFIRQLIIKREAQDLLLRQKNEELNLSHQKLNYAQKMAHLGSWHWNVATNELLWSDEVFRIMGDDIQSYAPTFDRFLEKIHPEDRARADQAIQAALSNHTPYEVEHRIIRSDETVRHVREQGEVTVDGKQEISGMVGTILDMTAIIELQQKLEKLAITDELTGALNRRQLFREGEKLCKLASRYQTPFSVIFYDLDHFKSINDSYGHLVGDEVLQQITAVVRDSLRDADILARYGGEEFCILAPETEAQQAENLAERIRNNVKRHIIAPSHHPTFVFNVTISLGITEHVENETFSSVIDRADQAAYQAKQKGRDCSVVD
nr:diguanylate cyclase [uncultured Desulfuromonas sp.]